MSNYDQDKYQYTSGNYPGQFAPGPSSPQGPPHGSNRGRSKSKSVHFTRGGLAALVIVCILISGSFGFGGALLADNYFSNNQTTTDTSNNANSTGYKLEEATGSSMTVQEITEAAQKSIVEIRTEAVTADTWMQEYVTEGAGSGVIIKSDGYIITNNHVISGATKIYVTTKDGKEYTAKLVGADADTDIAVLKVNAKNLSAVTYGDSSKLKVGDLAVAIGNPLGQLGGTVTAGIISALDRSMSIEGKTMSLLQTDTSINPGNSGGGLFNQYGQLVGIVVAKSSGSDVEGLGFAIPINKAANVSQQLMTSGYVKGHVTTGMSYVDMSQQQGQQSIEDFFSGGMMQQNPGGVYIQEVKGKNAKLAGFRSGDMVYSVDGEQIDSMDTLSAIITSHKVGDKVKYVVIRDNVKKEITLKLTEKTSSQ